ncbi:uncharacterized protein BO97DRAFT_470503 [Aspergillus homomorphus CBS 101889]|uniref:Uncharacterized protein n=1 Tax=Aspergillus homomorphus (strain CBS 101889) TaxID=1450537 RepID=A0A395HZK6_ASPHC|nr:hypothetical protein BO97DRAFT_470503 [Aspergillus homomorphus CBS 101889]RAL12308.1 hypothetical protein BO97DRAFT_470503 [Aspergillus homomorphus CBS 101889]
MIKSNIPHWLCLCVAALGVHSIAKPVQQKPLVGVDVMVKENKVPGHNDAIYDIFLEVAPTPILADRVFFVYLRSDLPESKKKKLGLFDESLINATLSVSGSVVYPDGSYMEPRSFTMPLKTISINDAAHFVIRDSNGTQIDYLPSSDRSDMLLDFQIPAMFLKSGMWTFEVDARLGDKDNSCLFAMSLTQWLDWGL